MEWNFTFRIDYLKQRGEERSLKGVIYTENGQAPELAQIMQFLSHCGYRVELKDAKRMLFADPNPDDPVEITIVRIGDKGDRSEHDPMLKLLAEQFMKE